MRTKTTHNTPRCAVCGGELKGTTITHEEHRGANIYLFQNVLTKVCTACGEIWIDEEVLQQLDRLIAEGYQPSEWKHRCTISVPPSWLR